MMMNSVVPMPKEAIVSASRGSDSIKNSAAACGAT
jgi:hypothetical protein